MAKATFKNTTPSRRAILAGTASLPALAAVQMSAFAGTDDDARILELERLINVQYEKGWALHNQIDEDRQERMSGHYRNNGNKSSEELHRIWIADPHNVEQESICGALSEAIEEADPYINEMYNTPAKTMAGRQAKLRILKNWLWHDDFTTPLDNADWEIEKTRRLLAELCEMPLDLPSAPR